MIHLFGLIPNGEWKTGQRMQLALMLMLSFTPDAFSECKAALYDDYDNNFGHMPYNFADSGSRFLAQAAGEANGKPENVLPQSKLHDKAFDSVCEGKPISHLSISSHCGCPRQYFDTDKKACTWIGRNERQAPSYESYYAGLVQMNHHNMNAMDIARICSRLEPGATVRLNNCWAGQFFEYSDAATLLRECASIREVTGCTAPVKTNMVYNPAPGPNVPSGLNLFLQPKDMVPPPGSLYPEFRVPTQEKFDNFLRPNLNTTFENFKLTLLRNETVCQGEWKTFKRGQFIYEKPPLWWPPPPEPPSPPSKDTTEIRCRCIPACRFNGAPPKRQRPNNPQEGLAVYFRVEDRQVWNLESDLDWFDYFDFVVANRADCPAPLKREITDAETAAAIRVTEKYSARLENWCKRASVGTLWEGWPVVDWQIDPAVCNVWPSDP